MTAASLYGATGASVTIIPLCRTLKPGAGVEPKSPECAATFTQATILSNGGICTKKNSRACAVNDIRVVDMKYTVQLNRWAVACKLCGRDTMRHKYVATEKYGAHQICVECSPLRVPTGWTYRYLYAAELQRLLTERERDE